MHKNSEDRRARRSRRLLKESLLELMQEKEFKDISARDITESADLNRGTFYLHYPDTQSLLNSIEDDVIAEVQQLIDAHLKEAEPLTSLQPVLLPILDYIEQKRRPLELLLRNGNGSIFLDKLHGLIHKNSLEYAKQHFAIEDSKQLDYFLSFVSFGIMAMFKEWVNRGMTLPKQKIAAYADALMDSAAQVQF
jgi:AcrR family transcriptional regulator